MEQQCQDDWSTEMFCIKSFLLACVLFTEYLLGDLNSNTLKVLMQNVHKGYENVDDSVGTLFGRDIFENVNSS